MEMAKDTVRNMYLEVYNSDNYDERGKLAEHARKSESAHRLKSMVELVKSEPLILVKSEQLNSNPMLLNCQNGTLDLRTGILLPNNKDNLITKITPVDFDPKATCPIWERHLKRITGNNEELIGYLQRVYGYTLTGSNREQVFFIKFGSSKTGKSVTQGTIRWLLGDYGASTPSATLLYKKNESHSDMARLIGSRMVTAVETEEGQKLNAPMIKAITGNDRLAARLLYSENTEFEPTFKIFLSTNDKPIVRGEDGAIWERLKLIPFTHFIPPEERDKDIFDKFKEEGSGILNWCLRGCLEWQKRNGLDEPNTVTEQTAVYRDEMDILVDFLDDCCRITPMRQVTKTELYDAYENWCRDNKEEPMRKETLTRKLRNYSNIQETRTGRQRIWLGIALKNDTGDANEPFSVNSPLKEDMEKVTENSENLSPEAKRCHTDGLLCHACGGSIFWPRADGARICSVCHPKPT